MKKIVLIGLLALIGSCIYAAGAKVWRSINLYVPAKTGNRIPLVSHSPRSFAGHLFFKCPSTRLYGRLITLL